MKAAITVHLSFLRHTVFWSGGTSTQIIVYPPDGDFATRNFDFRISTATVEVEETNFTFFEGITRHLMILKGELELIHVNRYEKILRPYDQDTFSGEWETKSKGKVTDFNLMLKNGYTGNLKHRKVVEEDVIQLIPLTDWNFVYVAEGGLTVDGKLLNPGDMCEYNIPCEAKTSSNTGLIFIEVKKP